MELTHKLRDAVDDVLANFNFDKVASVMNFLNWTWGFEEEIPDKFELIKTARRIIFDAIKELKENSEFYIATGGFYACVMQEEETGYVSINLSFRIEDINSYDYDTEEMLRNEKK